VTAIAIPARARHVLAFGAEAESRTMADGLATVKPIPRSACAAPTDPLGAIPVSRVNFTKQPQNPIGRSVP
jgi:hypothetical protein